MPSTPAWNLRLRSRRLADRLLRLGWAAPLLAVVALMVARPLSAVLGGEVSDYSGPGALLFLSTPLWIAASMFAGRSRKLSGDGVRVDGRQLMIERAKGKSTSFGPIVQGAGFADGLVLEDEKGRELTVATPKPAELLDALDLEAAKRRFTFRWRRGGVRAAMFLLGFFVNVVVSALVLAPIADGRIGAPLLCAALGASPLVADLISRWAADHSVSVGLDGIATRSFRGARLFRFADVAHVQVAQDDLVIITKDQKVHRLASPTLASEREAIEARVREAMDAARAAAGDHPQLAALLDRAGRTLPEWRDAAARILTAATGFRDAVVGERELSSVLSDASAPAEQRVAAAIALGQLPEHRPKIRVAAETCASPRLRVALEALAEGEADDATLSRALAEAER